MTEITDVLIGIAIGFSMSMIFVLWINESWYRECSKMNKEWGNFCKEMNDSWVEFYEKFNEQKEEEGN